MCLYIHILEASDDEGLETSALDVFPAKADELLYAGIVIFAWISLVLHRANDALRKQVALKQEYSRLQCVSLAAALIGHVPLIMLCLHQERLWQRFLFLTPSPAPEVCLDLGQKSWLLTPIHKGNCSATFVTSWCGLVFRF